jgi:putative FmdB family regulatory protein
MPTYDYECTVCKHRFEASHSMTAVSLAKCPKCGKKLRRLIGSGGGIIFKGSGFYATDYRKKDTRKKDAETAKPCSTCPSAHSCPTSHK